MAQTPGERAADIARIDAEFQESCRQRIESRSAMICALKEAEGRLEPNARRFVEDMHYKATTFDMGGVYGGPLLDLSQKQLSHLESLSQSMARQPKAVQAPEPGSRAERYRNRSV